MANTKIDNTKQFFNQTILLESLIGKAKTLQKKYRATDSMFYLDKSLKIYPQADKLVDEIRQSHQNYQDQLNFATKAKALYADAIQLQIVLYEKAKEIPLLEKAFYYSEKSKANTLRQLLNDTEAKEFAGISPDILTLEKDIKTDHAYYKSRVTLLQTAKELDSVQLTSYENKLFETNRKQDSLTEILEKNYPKYYQLKHQNKTVTIDEIQQQLDPSTTVLEFFTTDSITYAFTISKNDFTVQELATPNLENTITQLQKSITTKNTAVYKETAQQLYQQLLAPVKEKLVGKQLIIIPDGALWHLNFDLLLTERTASNDPAALPYLLRDYTISYGNSANLLFTPFKSKKSVSKKQKECLAFSYSDSISSTDARTMRLSTLRASVDDLPGTRKEIKAISELVNGAYFFGSDASEANFKKNAANYNILHLALHGEVDHKKPENSKLFFTKSKDTVEDNYLYAHELFALDIPAELTVLSACNTGSGKIAKGEGIMSLGNAFQYAGTKSLLLSGWEVSDQTTPQLMQAFYTNLKKGMNKATALQQAKLSYLNTAAARRTHPFYWGSFYLLGDTTPILFDRTNYWAWGIAGSLVALLVFGIVYFRTKNS